MADTADHRAEMYSLAQSRLKQGLPSWAGELDLADVYHDDDLEFTAKRDEIIARIKRLAAYVVARNAGERYLVDLVEELAKAEGVREFDLLWSDFYDWADIKRVWIKTF